MHVTCYYWTKVSWLRQNGGWIVMKNEELLAMGYAYAGWDAYKRITMELARNQLQ